MYQYYTFFYHYIEIGLCRKGRETVFTNMLGSYLMDDSVIGVALKPSVSWHMCKDEDAKPNYSKIETDLTDSDEIYKFAKAHHPKVRRRIVMFKESDCDEYRNAMSSYKNRDKIFKSVSETIKMNDAFLAMATDLYKERSEKEEPMLNNRVVAQAEFDYCMPADVEEYDYDYPTIVLPLKSSDVEPGVYYRFCIVDLDEVYYVKEYMPGALFFKYRKPLTREFIAQSASIRVRPRINGKYPFNKAKRYRHYSNFYADVHYDAVCEEVEVNPAFACVKLKIPKGIGDEMPTFYMSFSHNGKPILERYSDEDERKPILQACRYVKLNNTTAVICCPLKNDDIDLPKGMITARLIVFDTCIAEFTFSTEKTEQGEYFKDELLLPKP